MAQAAFFVNDLKIIDQGTFLILEAQRRCGQGQVIERVFLTFPPESKHLFAAFGDASHQDVERPDTRAQNAWPSRIEKCFNQDN